VNKQDRALAPQDVSDEGQITKPNSVVVSSAEIVASSTRIAKFRNRPMILEQWPFPHFIPLTRETFDGVAYPLLGGVTRSRMSDVFAYLANTAEDLTGNDHLILFGLVDSVDGDFYNEQAQTRVWDMEALEWVDVAPEQAIWRSPYGVIQHEKRRPVPFIMSLAGNSPELYDDIMQSLAPMVMEQKPDGVIWWVGDGANGKSTLMDALYRIFPGQLSSITVKSLTDGRDTPRLNGTLANIVKESSEGRIEDTEIYKAVGTHEDFTVHKFHSQDSVTIRGNMHHIFSANNIPSFNDKGWSARRRTFIVPFTQRFESDPTFEARTFNAQMFGELIAEMCRYAVKLREQGYRYKFSADTLAAKAEYDTEANNAEEYAKSLVADGVVAFESFHPIQMDYVNWCADNGYVPLGVQNMRRAVQGAGFERLSIKTDAGVKKVYRLPTVDSAHLQPLGMMRPGMFTLPGFTPHPTEPPSPPAFTNPPPQADDDMETDTTTTTTKSVLKGKW
jgi:hypothetical protein